MDGTRFSGVIWVALAAFAGFELALAANYILLRVLLRAMQFGIRRVEPAGRVQAVGGASIVVSARASER